jgi:ketosteroid isomerase-like protein
MSDLTDLARRYYRAYEDDDRNAMEVMLAPDFTFTSPYDDAISREAFFVRCWPNHVWLDKFHLELVLVEGNRVMVMYRFEAKVTDANRPNLSFRNAECLTFEKDRLIRVDVFFGDPPSGMTRAQFAISAGAG